MLFLLGVFIVLACVAGGYGGAGGHFGVLWQPLEFLIILGSGVGAFVIANPTPVIKGALRNLKNLFKGSPYKKADYIETLSFLCEILKLVKNKGLLAIEGDLENPHESDLFNKYPKFTHDHHSVDFFCDYMRLIIMGVDNHYQVDDLMTAEIDAHHHEEAAANGAITHLGDSTPALGIVAAVLGVIHTMGMISEPPDVLGHAIAAALVGTFFGIFVAYGFIGPMGNYCTAYSEAQGCMVNCIKIAILSNMQGNAPVISIEFARKAVPTPFRPSFSELEEALENNGG